MVTTITVLQIHFIYKIPDYHTKFLRESKVNTGQLFCIILPNRICFACKAINATVTFGDATSFLQAWLESQKINVRTGLVSYMGKFE